MISVRDYYDSFSSAPNRERLRGVLRFRYPHVRRQYNRDVIDWCYKVMGKENVYWFWDNYHFTHERDLTLFLMRWP